MKHIIFLAVLVGFVSCSSNSQNQVTSKGARGPASVGTTAQEDLWGKPISQNEVDFLEDLENSPAQHY